MALPKVRVHDREVVLLSGFVLSARDRSAKTPREVLIKNEDDLDRSVTQERDAFVFGYVGGKWVPAA